MRHQNRLERLEEEAARKDRLRYQHLDIDELLSQYPMTPAEQVRHDAEMARLSAMTDDEQAAEVYRILQELIHP